MKPSLNRILAAAAMAIGIVYSAQTIYAQNDIVYVNEKGRTLQVKGKITATSPDNVSVKTKKRERRCCDPANQQDQVLR